MSAVPELKATLTLPKTDFPMKANLPQNEPLRLKRWAELDIYGRQRQAAKDAREAGSPLPVYLLHDGHYEPLSALSYVWRNAGLVIGQLSISGTLGGVPGTPNWNAPLWTLA